MSFTGKKIEKWEKEFDDEFKGENEFEDGDYIVEEQAIEIKRFISSLLDQAIQSERQRIIKQIKSFMKKKCIVTTKDLIADITNEIKNENKNQIL